MAEASKEAAAPSGAFWDGLLRNQYQQLKALELAAMGKVSGPTSVAMKSSTAPCTDGTKWFPANEPKLKRNSLPPTDWLSLFQARKDLTGCNLCSASRQSWRSMAIKAPETT